MPNPFASSAVSTSKSKMRAITGKGGGGHAFVGGSSFKRPNAQGVQHAYNGHTKGWEGRAEGGKVKARGDKFARGGRARGGATKEAEKRLKDMQSGAYHLHGSNKELVGKIAAADARHERYIKDPEPDERARGGRLGGHPRGKKPSNVHINIHMPQGQQAPPPPMPPAGAMGAPGATPPAMPPTTPPPNPAAAQQALSSIASGGGGALGAGMPGAGAMKPPFARGGRAKGGATKEGEKRLKELQNIPNKQYRRIASDLVAKRERLSPALKKAWYEGYNEPPASTEGDYARGGKVSERTGGKSTGLASNLAHWSGYASKNKVAPSEGPSRTSKLQGKKPIPVEIAAMKRGGVAKLARGGRLTAGAETGVGRLEKAKYAGR